MIWKAACDIKSTRRMEVAMMKKTKAVFMASVMAAGARAKAYQMAA